MKQLKKKIFLMVLTVCLNAFQSDLYGQHTPQRQFFKTLANAKHWYEKEMVRGANDTNFSSQNKPAWKLASSIKQPNGSLLQLPVYQKDRLNRFMYIHVVKGNYTGVIKEFYKRNNIRTEITTYTVKGRMLEDGHTSENGVYQVDWSAKNDAAIQKAKNVLDTNVYVSTYVLTARDKEIERKINAEDDASDAMVDIKCQGRSAPGNKPFRGGRMAYYLIKFDFLSSGSGNQREVDFQVPLFIDSQSKGYVDLADRTTHEMFIIKPDDPEQIVAGKIELATLVTAAQKSCGNDWHMGSAFKDKVIPNGNGANLRMRLVHGTGVIVFTVRGKESHQ